MSDVHYKKHVVFRETEDVIFYDISVEESNASDLVIHSGPALSPPNDSVGAKQFYIHSSRVQMFSDLIPLCCNRLDNCEHRIALLQHNHLVETLQGHYAPLNLKH